MMHGKRMLAAAAAASLSACGLFHHSAPAVQLSQGDVALHSTWHATLSSPSDLAGAMQVSGQASMAPESDHDKTMVSLTLSNATPGGVHPWEIHHGQCDTDAGIIGQANAYPPIKIANDGTGSATATLPLVTPDSGSYFIAVRASTANPDLVVACGNFAPPTR
ncbi:MAG TPA: hypothetical protein VFW89_01745 [Gemmatimonadaceae bacterium]|nr:hypothetical protein [Gemmatimonadaceae bacterium]